MAKKRIKVSAINLFGPALIFVVALFAVENGHTSLATVVGILGIVTLLIGASSVRVIWKPQERPQPVPIAVDAKIVPKKRSP